MLTTTGAKTGQQRTFPVLGVPDGDNLVVIASNWGQRHYPAWYYNLRVHSTATVAWAVFPGASRPVRPSARSGSDCGSGPGVLSKIRYLQAARRASAYPRDGAGSGERQDCLT
jgi:hypothetical protein